MDPFGEGTTADPTVRVWKSAIGQKSLARWGQIKRPELLDADCSLERGLANQEGLGDRVCKGRAGGEGHGQFTSSHTRR